MSESILCADSFGAGCNTFDPCSPESVKHLECQSVFPHDMDGIIITNDIRTGAILIRESIATYKTIVENYSYLRSKYNN